MDRTGGLAAIGNTPVVRLARMADDACAEVWVKMEAANPTGSYKDRMALAMIEAAEADGSLRPGQLVVEYTGGSTGSSLAFVCAVKGYPFVATMAETFSVERRKIIRVLGGTVILTPAAERGMGMVRPKSSRTSPASAWTTSSPAGAPAVR